MKTNLLKKMNKLGLQHVTGFISGEPSWKLPGYGFNNLFGAECLSEVCGHFAGEIEDKMQERGADLTELRKLRKELLVLEQECLEQEMN